MRKINLIESDEDSLMLLEAVLAENPSQSKGNRSVEVDMGYFMGQVMRNNGKADQNGQQILIEVF